MLVPDRSVYHSVTCPFPGLPALWSLGNDQFLFLVNMHPLLLLSRFSRFRLCATPETAAHQAPRSLGFSRQEHWSGLPFPSPMHESEKWKGSHSVVSDSSWARGLQPIRLLRPWDFPGKSAGVGCHCLPFSINQQTFLCIKNAQGMTELYYFLKRWSIFNLPLP